MAPKKNNRKEFFKSSATWKEERKKLSLLVHEIFAAKEQQDAKTWLNIIKLPTQWSGAYLLGIAMQVVYLYL